MATDTISCVPPVRSDAARGPHWIDTLPMVVLMPHSGCNCRCIMCDIWKANQNKRVLSKEDISRQLDDLRRLKVRLVTLSGGEAMLGENIWKLCHLLRELGVVISLMSTGLLLRKYAEQVVHWCDAVTLSMDGGRALHDTIRRIPGAFDALVEGVAAVKTLKPDFPVIGRCVLQRANFRSMPLIIHAAKAAGLDKISFLPADVTSEAFNRPNPWPSDRAAEIALNADEAAEFDEVVENVILHYAHEIAAGFIHETPAGLRRLPRYYAALLGKGSFPPVHCNAPWVSAVVEADQTVRPCYFLPSIGNLNGRSLTEVLNSKEALAFRSTLDVSRHPVCQRCVCPLLMQRGASPA